MLNDIIMLYLSIIEPAASVVKVVYNAKPYSVISNPSICLFARSLNVTRALQDWDLTISSERMIYGADLRE